MQKKQYWLVVLVIFFAPIIASARVGNDPFAEQWAYEDTGAYKAWDLATGSREVVVAIIDSGFDYLHPDLKQNVWKNTDEIANNNIDDDKNGYVDDVWGWNFVWEDVDENGKIDDNEKLGNNNPRPDAAGLTADEQEEGIIHHATLVAGVVGAVGNNGLDGVGINWQVRLMNLKIVDNSGTGELDGLAKAIRYAVDNGADVINVSLVGSASSAELTEQVEYAYSQGVPIIAAAGNSNIHLDYSPLYPICTDAGNNVEWVLGVSAMEESHRLASFSNNGASCIDITAPGVHVSSTQRFSPKDNFPDRYGGGWSGTSFATPLVSGAAALIKSIQPEWGSAEIYEALLSTVHHTPGQDEVMYAQIFGAGLLQIDKAIEYAMSKPIAVPKVSKMTKIMSIAKEGFVNIYNVNNQSQDLVFYSALNDIDGVASGKTFFVTSRRLNNLTAKISIYDKNWKPQATWEIAASGLVELGVADVLSVEGEEIVVAPKYADDQVFRVYSQAGAELGQYSLKGEHKGISFDFSAKESGRSWIEVLYNDGSGLTLAEFNNNLALIKKTPINFPKDKGILRTGDIDGDGADEYVIASASGKAPILGFYEANGIKKKLFEAYDLSYDYGFDIEIIDGNSDGTLDVVSVPISSSQPNIVWSGMGEKILEWDSFDTLVNGMKVLVY